MGITQSEIQHLREVHPFAINSVPIPITSKFTHLGIDYNLDHPSATANRTVETRLQTGRSTTYAIMGTGLCGWNGVNPITWWHIYKIYIQPKILFSLEAMNVTGNKASLYRLGVSLRTFLKSILTLPGRAANTALHIMLGCLPAEPIIEQRQLILITSISQNPLMLEIIIRQIAVKSLKCTSWVVATQKLQRKYNLPPMLEVISWDYSAKEWKRMVKKAVSLLEEED